MRAAGRYLAIVGASKLHQLSDQLAALDLQLSPEQHKRLDEGTAPRGGNMDRFFKREMRGAVFGDSQVRGWGE